MIMNAKKLFRMAGVLLAAAASLLSAGCTVMYQASVVPPQGALYTHLTAPLTHDLKSTPCGKLVKKYSKSKSYYFHDPVFTGLDLSFHVDGELMNQIAREGGISKIAYADYELVAILDAYAKFTINVYGY